MKKLIWILLLLYWAENAFAQNAVQITGKTEACHGEIHELVLTGCYAQIKWYKNGVALTDSARNGLYINASGTFFATCLDGSGNNVQSSFWQVKTSQSVPQKPTISSGGTLCTNQSITISATGCAATDLILWRKDSILIVSGSSTHLSVSQAGSYSAACQNACGTSPYSKAETVLVKSVPTGLLISSNFLNLCENNILTLTANGCNGNVLWNTQQISESIEVGTEGVYTAICQNECGKSGSSNSLEVYRFKTQPPSISANKTELCNGQVATISAKACTGTIEWSNGQIGPTISASPRRSTTYTATCIVNGCRSEASNVVILKVCNTADPLSVGDYVWTDENQNGIQDPIEKGTAGVKVRLSLPNASVVQTVTNDLGRYEFKNLESGSHQISIEIPVNYIFTTPHQGTNRGADSDFPSSGKIAFWLDTLNRYDLDAGLFKMNCDLPMAKIQSNGTLACKGLSMSLRVANCPSGVEWSNGQTGTGIQITPTTNVAVRARCTSAQCTGAWSDSLKIQVSDKISAPIIESEKQVYCGGSEALIKATGCPEGSSIQWAHGKIGASIIEKATANLTYKAKCQIGQCSSDFSPEFQLLVAPAVAPPTIKAAGKQLCKGDSLVLYAYGCAGQVLWSNQKTGGVIWVNPSSNTTFTATCSETSGCQSVPSEPLDIKIADEVTQPVVKSLAAFCPTNTVVLNDALLNTLPLGYQLLFKNQNDPKAPTIPSDVVSATGTYYAFFKDLNSCMSTGVAFQAILEDCATKAPKTDVSILLKGTTGNLKLNEIGSYQIVLTNQGKVEATEIGVSLQLPTGLSYVTGSNSLTKNPNGSYTLTKDKLKPAEAMTVSFDLKNTDALGQATIKAEITHLGIEDSLLANNTSYLTINANATKNLGLAKSVGFVKKENDGLYAIPFVFILKNYGSDTLKNVQISDDIAAVFGKNGTLDSQPIKIETEGLLKANSLFLGSESRIDILQADQSILLPFAENRVTVWAKVDLANSNIDVFENQALASALKGIVKLTDASTNGASPDPDGDNDPTNNSVKTAVLVPIFNTSEQMKLGVSLAIIDTLRQANTTLNVSYMVLIKNLGNKAVNHIKLENQISDFIKVPYSLVGSPSVNKASYLKPNPFFNGNVDFNLLAKDSLVMVSPGKTDTLFFTINVYDDTLATLANQVKLHYNAGLIDKMDLSNPGSQVIYESNSPTILNLNKYNGLMASKGVSPNDDAINDTWLVRSHYGPVDVEIYNRWGSMVYRKENYNNEWSGQTHQGKESLPMGVYFYKIVTQSSPTKSLLGYLILYK